jgi:hypothetical protein
MKSKIQFLKKTLGSARSLQADYDRLGAPSTQNVRNPDPMWALVQQALPKKNVIAIGNLWAIIDGKRKSIAYKALIPVEKFGDDVPSGATVEELVQTIKDHGFLAKKGSVNAAINSLKAQGLVEVTRHQRPSKTKSRRNVSFCRYMML